MKRILISILILSFSVHSIDVHKFESEDQRQTYQKLTQELRCLVCQNQNIADSNAPLAQDLRREVALMVNSGQTEQQISDFMIERYGDFVQYNPPLRLDTIVLWFLPVIVMAIAAIVLFKSIKRTQKEK